MGFVNLLLAAFAFDSFSKEIEPSPKFQICVLLHGRPASTRCALDHLATLSTKSFHSKAWYSYSTK